ncbi:MAG TPA: hypothetical protein VLD84_08085 [Nitrososphaeraceae archaeon]|nr:hypothetical protein [Nitrososphaeraceae archaeon]
MSNTFDKIKRVFGYTAEKTADLAQKVTDPDVYTGSNNTDENREEKGGKEPMNVEDIAERKPTAVKRDTDPV